MIDLKVILKWVKQIVQNPGQSLTNRSLMVFSIRAVSLVLTLTTSIFLTHWMGASGYGVFNYCVTWVVLISGFTTLGFENLLVGRLAIYHENKEWGLIKGLLATASQFVTVFSSLAFLGMLLLLFTNILPLDQEKKQGLMVMSILIPFFALTNLKQFTLLGFSRLFQSQFYLSVFRPALFLIAVFLCRVLWGFPILPMIAITALVISYLFVYFLKSWMSAKAIPLEARCAKAEYQPGIWLHGTLFIFLFRTIDSFDTQADVLLLGSMVSNENLGIYSLAKKLSGFVSMPMLLMDTLLFGEIASAYARGDSIQLQKTISRAAKLIFGAGIFVWMVMIFAGKPVLAFFGKDFESGYYDLVILSTGELLNVSFGPVVALLLMTGHEKQAVLSIAVALLLNVAACLIMIPLLGTEGAAWAYMLSFACWNLLMWYFVRSKLTIKPTVWGW